MKLTNKMRKQIVTNMVEAFYRPKITEWEKSVAQFIKDSVLKKYDTEIKWYKHDVDDCFKHLVKTNTTFCVTAEPESTPENKYPNCAWLQPRIECNILIRSSGDLISSNLICKIGQPRDWNRTGSNITKTQVDTNVPSDSQDLTFTYTDKTKQDLPFFKFVKSKRDLENAICADGEKWFEALTSISTVERLIENLPSLEKYLPDEATKPKPVTAVVPVELYNNINKVFK